MSDLLIYPAKRLFEVRLGTMKIVYVTVEKRQILRGMYISTNAVITN